MNSNTTNVPEPPEQVQAHELDQILKAVWETAARRDPMVLLKMIDPNTAIEHLRRMIRDCLAKGLSATETCDHAVKELLQSAIWNTQLHDACNDTAAEKEAPAS
jgi:hypothetical protein